MDDMNITLDDMFETDESMSSIVKEYDEIVSLLEKKKFEMEKKIELSKWNQLLGSGGDMYLNFTIVNNCRYDKDSLPWTNIIANNYDNCIGGKKLKHTIEYPLSHKFDSDLRELISRYINGDVGKEDASIVGELDSVKKELEKLKEETKRKDVENGKKDNEIKSLKRRMEKFNKLSWYEKICFKFKI